MKDAEVSDEYRELLARLMKKKLQEIGINHPKKYREELELTLLFHKPKPQAN